MKKSFKPPIPHYKVPENLELEPFTEDSLKSFKNSYGYKKHVLPAIKRDKKFKKQRIKQWLADNWIALTTLIATVITLFVTLLK